MTLHLKVESPDEPPEEFDLTEEQVGEGGIWKVYAPVFTLFRDAQGGMERVILSVNDLAITITQP